MDLENLLNAERAERLAGEILTPPDPNAWVQAALQSNPTVQSNQYAVQAAKTHSAAVTTTASILTACIDHVVAASTFFP